MNQVDSRYLRSLFLIIIIIIIVCSLIEILLYLNVKKKWKKQEKKLQQPLQSINFCRTGGRVWMWTPTFSFALHSVFLMITWPGDQRFEHLQSSISVTHSVSLHVMSWAHVRAWHQHQYPAVPIQYPDVQSRLVGQPVQTWRNKKIILHWVHQFLWCPEDPAARWDDLGYVVAVQLSRLHQHQLPLHHHHLLHVPQPVYLQYSTTTQQWTNDCKRYQDILWICYQPFVQIFMLVQ